MRRRAALSIILASLALAFAPAPLTRKPSPIRLAPSMEGEWAWPNGRRLAITATRFTLSSDKRTEDYLLTVDRSKVPPSFDLLKGGEVWVVGIYRVEGDRLYLSFYKRDKDRPTAFEGEGAGQVEVCERIR